MQLPLPISDIRLASGEEEAAHSFSVLLRPPLSPSFVATAPARAPAAGGDTCTQGGPAEEELFGVPRIAFSLGGGAAEEELFRALRMATRE